MLEMWDWRSGLRENGGDPGLIRTADPQFRKLLLYPSELRGHIMMNNSQEHQILISLYTSPRVNGNYSQKENRLQRDVPKVK